MSRQDWKKSIGTNRIIVSTLSGHDDKKPFSDRHIDSRISSWFTNREQGYALQDPTFLN